VARTRYGLYVTVKSTLEMRMGGFVTPCRRLGALLLRALPGHTRYLQLRDSRACEYVWLQSRLWARKGFRALRREPILTS
jgi:hypothetical protein